jgi:hypothetical protein
MASVMSVVRNEDHPYYHLEPWDVGERPDWVLDQARKDGIDLFSERITKHTGPVPRDFQTGYFHSDAFIRIIMAGSQTGKSHNAKYEIPMMLTGVYPICFRHPRGEDTGVKRMKTEENIRRFGRFTLDGDLIDHDDTKVDDIRRDWNCGNIIGAGLYPQIKKAPAGSTIWVGTFQKAMDQYWWPSYYDGPKQIIPAELIDRNRGHNGFAQSEGKKKVFLIGGGEICFITYESGFERFEALNLHAIVLDEEPKDPRIFSACQERCKFLSIIETPYQGITYTEKLAFPDDISPDLRLFHATQYDSPYQTKKMIDIRRKNNPPWEVGARVWGIPTDTQGEPYYDRMKITNWYSKFNMPFEWKKFEANREFHSMTQQSYSNLPGLEDVGITCVDADDDNRTTTWRVYEDVKPMAAYVIAVDPAEGSDNPDEAADTCAAVIVRAPDYDNGETKPTIVATLRSTLETTPFALCCAQAAQYYNNALLGAETKRGACNAMFASELTDYRYWYMFSSIQESTQKVREQPGFDTNARTRPMIFKYIEKWIGEFEPDDYPMIPDRPLLNELAACIVGKGGKPDHTKKGTLDTAICFGIILYILDVSPEQVRYNGPPPEKRSKSRNRIEMARAQWDPKSSNLGLDNLGYRRSLQNA